MLFLIDENLPETIGKVFTDRGFQVESVKSLPQLHGQPDEVIFNYAVEQQAIIVTRDLDFANPLRFDLRNLLGIIILRFPNEISMTKMIQEVKNLFIDFAETDFHALIIASPGSIRKRRLVL